ncbi:integrin alpha-PS1-like [Argonauta hians]
MALGTHVVTFSRPILVVIMVWAVILSPNIRPSTAYNLDTELYIYKRGPPNSFFGYSMAFHKMQTRQGSDEFMFLVGAPQANDTGIAVEQPGQIQKCGYNVAETCQQLNISMDSSKPKKDQWFGVTLLSERDKQGANVMVCAHRYWEGMNFNGICYILDNDLTSPQPLLTNVRGDHTEYGSSQTGISAVFVPSASQVQTFGVGAPGVLNWRGTIYSKVIAFLGGDTSLKESKLGDEIKANSFVGYSITTGRFDSKGSYYATGAPRSQGIGQVLLVSHRNSKTTFLEHQPSKTLTGTKFGSSFGYSVASVDLNKDGYDDLVVGAPFYHDTKAGGAIYIYMGVPDGEMNNASKPIVIVSRSMNEQECRKLGCEHARFGAALANAYDLNQDGYDDLLVGAPYEGSGAVYIFHGSKDGIINKPSQRISASQLQHHAFKAFGSTFATGMDIDKNGYPDVIVGAFESDSLALLLSRPVLTLTSNITLSKSVDLNGPKTCPKSSPRKHCIDINLCLAYNSTISLNEKPEIEYTIIPERFDPRILTSRVSFFDGQPSLSNKLTNVISLDMKGKSNCYSHKAYLKDSFRDKLTPIKFQFTYQLKGKPLIRTKKLPQMNAFPVLDLTSAEETTEVKEVEIQKECGADDICQSDLQLTAVPLHLTYDPKEDRYILNSKTRSNLQIQFHINNTHDPAYDTKLNIMVPNNVIYQGVNSEGNNQHVECASKKNGVIVCDRFGNPLMPGTNLSFIVKLIIEDLEDSNLVNIKANLTTISDEKNPEDNEVNVAIEMRIMTDIQVTGQSSPEQVLYTGNALGESAMKTEDDIGPVVKHIYDVYNKGSGTVPQSKLTIHWPYELASNEPHGKHLLYLMQPPKIHEGRVTCRHPTIINPASIKLSNSEGPSAGKVITYSRKRRSAPEASKITARSAKRKKSETISCDSGAKCYQIVCDIGVLQEGESAVIVIRSRLWEATLLEEYRNADEVNIRSRGSFEITSGSVDIKQTDLTNDEYDVVTVAIPDIDVSPPPPVAWWIILIAVIIGLLFLALLGIALWKCGFFKRRSRDQMKSYNAIREKNQEGLLK